MCQAYGGPRRLAWCHWLSLPASRTPRRRRRFPAELCGFPLCRGSPGCRRSPASPALPERSARGAGAVGWMQNPSCCHAWRCWGFWKSWPGRVGGGLLNAGSVWEEKEPVRMSVAFFCPWRTCQRQGRTLSASGTFCDFSGIDHQFQDQAP